MHTGLLTSQYNHTLRSFRHLWHMQKILSNCFAQFCVPWWWANLARNMHELARCNIIMMLLTLCAFVGSNCNKKLRTLNKSRLIITFGSVIQNLLSANNIFFFFQDVHFSAQFAAPSALLRGAAATLTPPPSISLLTASHSRKPESSSAYTFGLHMS